ncbi:MAG: prepilin-type N-terminal cleavage/methylation domain-containing protein [Chthoniobacteraceae bacterium]
MPLRPPRCQQAFTLIEVLVASTVLVLLVSLLASAMNSALSSVHRAYSKIDQFAAARAGFERLTATLSQATLNTYWDYDDSANPQNYIRKSELHFLIESNAGGGGQAAFFQAPLARSAGDAASGVLNAVGYWVVFSADTWKPPHIATSRSRYRLMQGIQPTESLGIYTTSIGASWTTDVTNIPSTAFPIADNVIALVLWPRLPSAQDTAGTELSGSYAYDSRSGTDIQKAQLPPIIQATMIVIDEASSVRLSSGTSEPAAIKAALKDRFQEVAKFQDDLDAVKAALNAAHVNYLVLSAPITLRESKWSATP